MRTGLRVAFAVGVSASVVGCSSKASHSDVTVSWSELKQTIDGFGASSAFFGQSLTDAQADQLFDAKKGIGLSLLRTMIGLPDDTVDGAEPTTGANPVPTAPELTTAQQAASRGAQVWAAAWTPPPIWKTTNNKNGSQHGDAGANFASNKLQPEHYQDFASYLGQYVDILATANPPVHLLGVSPANEPDYTATWDGAQWTPQELTAFIGQSMGPLFAQKYPSVKIIAPETANCPSCDQYVTPLLADATAAGYVSIIATHDYGANVGSYDKPQKAGKSFWETEWSQENAKGDTPDPSMTSALALAQRMHGDLVTSGMTAWSWWAVYVDENGLNDNTRLNGALIQPDATKSPPYMFKRGYALGNWSKFVRPGFQRIGATEKPAGGVLVEAYRDNDSHLAIIAINTTATVITQKFTVDGATLDAVTPWVTSPDDSLAAKSPLAVADDSFTFDLPASSVVTFVNWDANTTTPGQTGTGNPDGGPPKLNGLDCSAAVVPNNVVSGGVTDFTDWKGSTGKWGNPQGLYGAIYSYAGPKGSTMSANVDAANKDLHATGSVTSGDYGGVGIGFSVCATVTSFSKIQFDVGGSSPGCDMELQIKTFDQQPNNATPAGGCDPNAAAGCYNFPVAKQVAVPSATPATIVTPLAGVTNWSATNAAQVVGLQWQWTGTHVAGDGSAGCPIDVTITNVKFLP
jgi:glucuronoarabinoxylan endo-1,4-beta-xylanase